LEVEATGITDEFNIRVEESSQEWLKVIHPTHFKNGVVF
jgi:hypothetical protein